MQLKIGMTDWADVGVTEPATHMATACRAGRPRVEPLALTVMKAGLVAALIAVAPSDARAQINPSAAPNVPAGQTPAASSGTPSTGTSGLVPPSPASNVGGGLPPPAINPRISIASDFVPFETGKGPKVGRFYLNRAEEDFSYLRDPTKSNNLFDRFKFIRLNDSGSAYVTFSGEERLRFESFTKNSFSFVPPEHNQVLQLRSTYGADVHLGEYVRGFVQIANGAPGGRNFGQPTAAQRNDLSLVQAFGEASVPFDGSRAGVRIGRQEFWLGTGVNFSTREGSNIPSALDGFRGYFDNDRIRFDVFAFDNVTNHSGVLQDSTNAHSQYWGTQATVGLPGGELLGATGRLFLDAFYFGNYSRRATFANVTGADDRHMLGGRIWGQIGAFDVDTTGEYQFGSTANTTVSAYALFANAGYTFDNPASPRVGLRFTVASGGRDGPTVKGVRTGGTLNTFNPLLPVPGLFSESLLIAPINLIELTPSVSFSLSPKWRVFLDTIVAWRYAEHDGIYNLGFAQFRNTLTAPGRFLGVQPAIRTSYSLTPNLNLAGSLAYFNIGTVFRNARAKNNAYALAQTTLKF